MTTAAVPPMSQSPSLLAQAIARGRTAFAGRLPDLLRAVSFDLERSAAGAGADRHHRLMRAAQRLGAASGEHAHQAMAAFECRSDLCFRHEREPGDTMRVRHALAERDRPHGARLVLLARAVTEGAGRAHADRARRFAEIVQGRWTDDAFNPLGVRAIVGALLDGILDAEDDDESRTVMNRSLAARVPGVVRSLIDPVVAWLEDQQVRAPAGEGVHAGAVVNAARTVLGAAASARAIGVSPFDAGRAQPRLKLVTSLSPAVDFDGDGVAFARAIDAEPFSRAARAAFFASMRERIAASGASATQCAVMDLVAAMFDYIADDRRVAVIARPLLWRLQLPTAALALMDPNYLSDGPRTLRGLVETLGAVCSGHPGGLEQTELLAQLSEVVARVEDAAASLQSRLSELAAQIDHEYTRVAADVALLADRVQGERDARGEGGPRNRRDYRTRPGPEEEHRVTQRITSMLRERLDSEAVPDSVREFLFNVWLRRLRTAGLRDGVESATFRELLGAVDDLLWSLDPARGDIGREELAQRIPQLVRVLSRGAQETGARDDEYRFFFDELFLLHLRKMHMRHDEAGPFGPVTS